VQPSDVFTAGATPTGTTPIVTWAALLSAEPSLTLKVK
jgi:hypothetical protein